MVANIQVADGHLNPSCVLHGKCKSNIYADSARSPWMFRLS